VIGFLSLRVFLRWSLEVIEPQLFISKFSIPLFISFSGFLFSVRSCQAALANTWTVDRSARKALGEKTTVFDCFCTIF
jgi:hypothetical protein